MTFHCFKCQKQLELGSSTQVGRRDSCLSCNADLHVCRNCKFYDVTAYNSCREPQAERVLEKEQSNFCDYFVFREGAVQASSSKVEKGSKMSALEALFKK